MHRNNVVSFKRRPGAAGGAGSSSSSSSAASDADAAADGVAKVAVVVGAGPAGALAAAYLANLGWRVRVYEKRGAEEEEKEKDATTDSHPPAPLGIGGRSYNVVLSPRGLGALADAGVELPSDAHVALEGSVRHVAGDAAPSFSAMFKGTVSIDRNALADAIAASAEAKHGADVVAFARGVGVDAIDFDARVVTLAAKEASDPASVSYEQLVSYDLLVAADGVNSRVRSLLEAAGDVVVDQHSDEMLFKTIRLPAQTPPNYPHDGTVKVAATWRKCFHTWPRGLMSLLAPPCPNGSLTATVILPGGVHAANAGSDVWTFDKISTAEDAARFFAETFPDAFGRDVDAMTGAVSPTRPPEEELERFASARANPGGVTTTISSLAARDGTVALIGDAAHSMWPSLGQGCNAALETAQYLAAAIESAPGGDQKKAMSYFDAVRGPQVRAIGRLSEAGFGGVAKRAGNVLFFAKIAALTALHKALPSLFERPALTRINDPSWAYDDIEDAARGENGTLLAAFVALTAAAAGAAKFGARRVAAEAAAVAKTLALGEGGVGSEGKAIAVLLVVALLTAAWRASGRRRRNRKGNVPRARAAAEAAAGAGAS